MWDRAASDRHAVVRRAEVSVAIATTPTADSQPDSAGAALPRGDLSSPTPLECLVEHKRVGPPLLASCYMHNAL